MKNLKLKRSKLKHHQIVGVKNVIKSLDQEVLRLILLINCMKLVFIFICKTSFVEFLMPPGFLVLGFSPQLGFMLVLCIILSLALSRSLFPSCYLQTGGMECAINNPMANLDDMWSRFTLSEGEVQGADVPSNRETSIHRLAGKFLTKRIVNAKAIACTLKPL